MSKWNDWAITTTLHTKIKEATRFTSGLPVDARHKA